MSTKSYKAMKYYKDGVNAIRKNRQNPKNNILGDTDPKNLLKSSLTGEPTVKLFITAGNR